MLHKKTTMKTITTTTTTTTTQTVTNINSILKNGRGVSKPSRGVRFDNHYYVKRFRGDHPPNSITPQNKTPTKNLFSPPKNPTISPVVTTPTALGTSKIKFTEALDNVKLFVQRKNYSMAMDYCRQILNDPRICREPDVCAETYYQQGICNKEMGNLVTAIEQISKANKTKPDAEKLFVLADCYSISGKFDDAIACYQKVIKMDKSMALVFDATVNVVDLYERQGKISNAVNACKELISMGPMTPASYNLLAYYQERNGDVQSAMKTYLQTIKVNKQTESPDIEANARAHINLSDLYADLGKIDDAVLFCESIENKVPDSLVESFNETYTKILTKKAEIYVNRKKFLGAMVECEKIFGLLKSSTPVLCDIYARACIGLAQRNFDDRNFNGVLEICDKIENASRPLMQTLVRLKAKTYTHLYDEKNIEACLSKFGEYGGNQTELRMELFSIEINI
jgi:tetratricopeptide (TPR) repeat protein